MLTVLTTAMLPCTTNALHPSREEEFAEYDIMFYDPDSMAQPCATMGLGVSSGNSTAGLSEQQAMFVDQYQGIASALSVQYGIPWEAVMAQGILESAAGTSNFARNRNNFFGIGAVDSNPNNAHSFETPEAGWEGYFKFIRDNPRYRNHGAFQEPAVTDPYEYIKVIKAAGYATDPNYVTKVSTLITAILTRAGEMGWETSAQLAVSNPEMLLAAANNAEGANVGGETANTLGYCSGVALTGVYSKDIHDTILAFSWDGINSHAANDPVPAYYTALSSYNFFGNPDNYVRGGASCDAFVATIMRASGADPNFLCCGTSNQLAYLSDNPLYTEIENLGNVSNLQDGDIFILNGHIMIFVNENGNPRLAHASRSTRTDCSRYSGMLTTLSGTSISSCARVGERGNVFFSDNRGAYRIFRRTS
jgi:hypothetical protein